MEQRETFVSWARQERDDLLRFAVLVTASREAAVRVAAEALAGLRDDFRDACERDDPAAAARRLVVAAAQRLANGVEPLPADPGLAPDPAMNSAQQWAWRVWTERPPGVRAAVALYVLDGLPVRDVAWTLAMSESAVRSQVELTLMDVACVAQHRGRTTEPMAKAEPVLREVLAGMVAGRLPVVEVPRPSSRLPLAALGALAGLVLLVAVVWLPEGGKPMPLPAPAPASVLPAPGVPTWSGRPAPEAAVLPPPAAGRRWLSSRDVAVQVPVSWVPSQRSSAWGWVEVSSDGRTCAEPSLAVVGCAATSVSAMVAIQPYVPAAPVPGADLSGVLVRQVGTVWLVAGAPRGTDPALVPSILASAVVIGSDADGCQVRHRAVADPIATVRPSAPPDLTAWATAAPVVVCRYSREPAGVAPLVGSEVLDPAAVADLVAAISRTPAERSRCSSALPAVRVVVLRARVAQAWQELYVYPNNCGENHLDDGVDRREVTPEVCRLLDPLTGDASRCGG